MGDHGLTEFLRFVLIGLGVGGIYTLITQGVVVVYRGSGVLNFAQGAFVLVGAYAHYEFMVKRGLPAALSFVLAAAVGAAVGVLTQLLVLRRMRQSSPLTRVVATLGVLVVLQSAVVLRYGVDVKSVPSTLPTRRIELIPGAPIGLDRVLLAVIGIVMTTVLWIAYRFTPFGRLTTAVAENESAVASFGHSPGLIATGNWAIGGAVAALAGALIAPITFLQPAQLSMLVVPALAAGLVAGFASFPLALLASMAIGVAESLLSRYVSTPGYASSAPFLIVIAVLVLRGRSLPIRSHITDRLPKLGSGKVRPLPTVALFVVMSWLVLLELPPRWIDAFSVTMVFAILGLSVVAVTGFAGQLSLSQYVLAGVGALVAARMAESWGWSFLLALLGAIAVTAILGALVALPALRTRGMNLAIVTFGLATVIFALVLNNSDYTGGDSGIRVPSPSLFGWNIDPIRHPGRYAFVILVLLFMVALALCNVRRSAVGRQLAALRSNERAAAAVGINVYVSKVYGFVVGASIAALAGVLAGFRNANVVANQFAVFPSINVVAVTVVGGVGSVGGAVLGATLMQSGVAAELLRGFHGLDRYLPLAGGVILLHLVTSGHDLFEMNVHIVRRIGRGMKRAFMRQPGPMPAPADALAPQPIEDVHERVVPKVLEIQHMTVRFGGVVAVNDVSLEVRPGEVHGLIGPNGAGKTTVIDGIAGFVRLREGRVILDGKDLSRRSPRRRALSGVARSFQSLELFDDLTVGENVAVASDRMSPWEYVRALVRPGRMRLQPAAVAALQSFDLASDIAALPNSLPFGRRRTLAIARAVAAGPSVILLDEPASGLGDEESAHLSAFIRSLADRSGMGVLLVEHNLDLVLSVCDRVTVMVSGAVIARGTPAEVVKDPAVLNAYIGESHQSSCPRPSSAGSEMVLEPSSGT